MRRAGNFGSITGISLSSNDSLRKQTLTARIWLHLARERYRLRHGPTGNLPDRPIGLRHSRDSEPTAWHGLGRNKHEAIFLFRRRRAETIRDQRSLRVGLLWWGLPMLTLKVIAVFLGAGMLVSVFAGELGRSASRHHRVSLIETTLLAT